jgi:hypothetical protein
MIQYNPKIFEYKEIEVYEDKAEEVIVLKVLNAHKEKFYPSSK